MGTMQRQMFKLKVAKPAIGTPLGNHLNRFCSNSENGQFQLEMTVGMSNVSDFSKDSMQEKIGGQTRSGLSGFSP